jgi:hypothetical protein
VEFRHRRHFDVREILADEAEEARLRADDDGVRERLDERRFACAALAVDDQLHAVRVRVRRAFD